MPYSAMPSRLMPIDADGTVVGQAAFTSSTAIGPVTSYPSSADVIAWVAAAATGTDGGIASSGNGIRTWAFFPESRTLLGFITGAYADLALDSVSALRGSSDTTNGSDGTWESASVPGGYPLNLGNSPTTWRTNVAACTFSTAKTTVSFDSRGSTGSGKVRAVHLYGVKYAGQTPDDILFLDGDNAFAEYTADKDFGDRPLGTTVVKQFKLKNSSATKTATTIVVTCNDADFIISTDGVTYVTTFTISSLGPGVSSAVLYIRNTTPSPGAALGPRQVRLSAAVGSYV